MVVVLDKSPSENREIIELKASKKEVRQAAAPQTLEDRVNAAIQAAGAQPSTGRLSDQGAGAAAAAGVLTAVDEDEEGAEEAPVPNEFEYQTDNEEGGEDD